MKQKNVPIASAFFGVSFTLLTYICIYQCFLNGYAMHAASVASYSYVPSSPILVTLMMEAVCSSETSVVTRATRRTIPEDGILHSHRRENLKSYIALADWAL
jgi:hypothetical protein